MKTLAERERELIALEEQRRREQAAVTDREKACAAELVQNVNQYLEEKGIGDVILTALPRGKGVRIARGGDHLEISVSESGGTLRYRLDTGFFGLDTPTDAVDENRMLDAVLAFIGKPS